MFMIHQRFQALVGSGSLVRVCLLKCSKAFDKIDHNDLLNTLRDMNIHPVLVNSMFGFLSGRYQRVKLEKCTSRWNKMRAGVQQGT